MMLAQSLYPGPSSTEMVLVLTSLVMAAVVALAAIWAISRNRARKLGVLERALDNDTVDSDTKQELLARMNAPGFLVRLWAGGRILMYVAVIGGWLFFIGSIAFLLFAPLGDVDRQMTAVIATLSFAVLTVPFVLREFDGKRQAASRGP